jgi:hypothetical protein
MPKDQPPMPAEPSAVDPPPHPLHALTTYEIRDYRRLLEQAIKGIAPDAPVQAQLRAKLDAVTAEQDSRARIAARA